MLTRADKLLIGVLTVLSIAGILFTFTAVSETKAATVIVSVNGNVVKTLPLMSAHTKFTVTAGSHYDVVEIKDGKVRIVEADCPDKLCVKMGWISKFPQQIVCLPNRVVVKIAGTGEADVDAIIR